MQDLFATAKKSGKEQAFYIVVTLDDKSKIARLYFLDAVPLRHSSNEFVFSLGTSPVGASKITYVSPSDWDKQVVGTVHTHYIKSTSALDTTSTAQRTTISAKRTVERIVHEVSEADIESAKQNQIVVYAIEKDQVHKAMPMAKPSMASSRVLTCWSMRLNRSPESGQRFQGTIDGRLHWLAMPKKT